MSVNRCYSEKKPGFLNIVLDLVLVVLNLTVIVLLLKKKGE